MKYVSTVSLAVLHEVHTRELNTDWSRDLEKLKMHLHFHCMSNPHNLQIMEEAKPIKVCIFWT